MSDSDSAPATKADIKNLENNIGEKWVIPVLVAVITGIIGIITIIVEVKLKNRTEANIARTLEEDKALGQQTGIERASFYQQARELLENIDGSFEELCYFPAKAVSQRKGPLSIDEDKIAKSLEEYRRLIENAPASIDDDTKARMKKYSEFVADAQFEVRFGSLRDDNAKKQSYQNSKQLLRDASQAIKDSTQKPATK
jgi:uncharacterized membrane-anchored protein YhcB (DUF1043 family)